MIEAMIAGESDPDQLAGLADRRLRASAEDLREALPGRITSHHRFMLRLHLDQVDAIDRAIARLDEAVRADLDPFRSALRLVKTMPGLSHVSAQTALSENGLA